MYKLQREVSKRRKRGVNKPGKRNVFSAKSKERERKEKERAERMEREREERKKLERKEKERREKERIDQERQEKPERRDRERKDRHHRRREEDCADSTVNCFFFFYFWGPVLSTCREGTAWPPPQIYSGAILWCTLVLLLQWLIR